MLHYRKNVGGNWQTCSLTIEEAKAIQTKIINIGLGKLNEIRKVAETNKVQVSEETISVILAKVMPSYESLANDYIEGQIKKRYSDQG